MIYNLFMDPECRKKYELNDFRKNNLLRLRKFMNELLLDQIPNLSVMLRSLEELSFMNVRTQTLSNPLVVQLIPEIANSITSGQNWKEIAEFQQANYFKKDLEQQKEDMKKMADLYGQDLVEGIIDGFKCGLCRKEASKRCAQCQKLWYCSRECQVFTFLTKLGRPLERP